MEEPCEDMNRFSNVTVTTNMSHLPTIEAPVNLNLEWKKYSIICAVRGASTGLIRRILTSSNSPVFIV